jgi:hypothetical protein
MRNFGVCTVIFKSIDGTAAGCVQKNGERICVIKVNSISGTDVHIALQKSALLPSSVELNELS